MKRGAIFLALLSASVVTAPVAAKRPAAADENAVREIVKQIYVGYSTPMDELFPDVPDGEEPKPDNDAGAAVDGYEAPYSKSLDALIERWKPVGTGDELRRMNSFDWYCQCQDFDPKSAKMNSEKYDLRGKDKIDAKLEYAPVGGKGLKLTIIFVREDGHWVMDDLKFYDRTTLRKGLLGDIKDAAEEAKEAAKEAAKAKSKD